MDFYGDDISTGNVSQYGSANYDFGFLDNYIQSLSRPTKTNPNQILEGDNDFYDEENPEVDIMTEVEEEVVNSPDAAESEESFVDQEMSEYLMGDESNPALDYLLNYEYGTGTEETPDGSEDPEPKYWKGYSPQSTLGKEISSVESQGNYKATNPNSTATGKYQFLWSSWGDSIKKVTGVKSQQEFLNNPQAQEKYYSFYETNFLLPEVNKIKSEVKTNLSTAQLAKLVHFRGEKGARDYLKGEVSDKPEAYNMSISKYIGSKQTGGIAVTPEEQFIGLNNPYFDELLMPLQGTNTIRGLDSGQPVYVEDDFGNRKILYGPEDTTVLKGTVREKKLKKRK